jgi:putative ABC transport system permease protein
MRGCRTLVAKSLRFYWRTHLGIVLGVAVSTAILVGALVVGDSVRYTLRTIALSRLGSVRLALASPSRYFRVGLADDLRSALNALTAPILQMRGIAANSDGTARVNRVQVLGVDDRFWALLGAEPQAGMPVPPASSIEYRPLGDEAIVNERLASQLGVEEGDHVLLRVERISVLPRDAPMAIGEDFSVALRVIVKAVASDSIRAGLKTGATGRFSLQASQLAPLNAFVPIAWLQEKMDLPGRANMLLVGGNPPTPPLAKGRLRGKLAEGGLSGDLDAETANSALREHWELADADLELRELPEQGMIELRTNRVFLEPSVVSAAERAMPGGVGILTYFVNELRLEDRTTPYSIVAAVEGMQRQMGTDVEGQRAGGDRSSQARMPVPPSLRMSVPPSWRMPVLPSLIPSDMSDDEILINAWLAADLQAKMGDVLELTYFAFGPMRKLEEHKSHFRVRAVLPMEGAAVDPKLMPAFPGLSNIENCRDWEPGVPIDLSKIREKDEEYWDLYRGTPKAFVTLEAGQRMWSNRFGSLTTLRYPIQGLGVRDQSSGISHQGASLIPAFEAALKSELDPASFGLFFQPVREQAVAASTQAMNFGQLFLGLSFFLVVAALLLTGLLFVFGIEQRTEEMGTLLALGFPAHRVRRLFLLEGGILALLGGLLGAGSGILYTKAVLYALSTVWRGAVGTGHTVSLYYHAEAGTLIVGTAAGIFAALLAIWITSRRQTRHSVRELLAGELESVGTGLKPASTGGPVRFGAKPRFGLLVALGAGLAALVILGIVGTGRDVGTAGAFFGAGALLLVGCVGLSHAVLSTLEQSSGILCFTTIGLRNTARRWGRSLATIALLGCGSFLVIAIGANRHDPMKDADKRWSGTGGFALYGESTLPVLHDLNSKDGRKVYGLDTSSLESVEFVPVRVHDGDDASCLNLNRPQNPKLLGVRPEDLQRRDAFTFAKTLDGSLKEEPWLLLYERGDNGNTVSAVGDENTIAWAVGKSVGDELAYTDEKGQTFHIQIAGAIASSILQGSFLISEEEFMKRFPSESGYRMFLIDTPSESVAEVSRTLTRALQDVGLELTPTVKRLADFNTVQNTYLSIFQSLGGLALLLGSLGLGIVVLRNVMERRGELALLRAVGFRNRSLQWLVLSEHWLLLLLGLACGVVAGLVAVLPALRSPGADVPYGSLTLTLSAILLNGALWTWLAAKLALRGPLLAALRNE